MWYENCPVDSSRLPQGIVSMRPTTPVHVMTAVDTNVPQPA